jgi:plastocyanin
MTTKGALTWRYQVKQHLFLSAVLAALALAAAACTPAAAPTDTAGPTAASGESAATSVTIEINGASFGEPLTIAPGTTVVWVNNHADVHTVTSDTGLFDSGNLSSGQTFEHTFDEPGEFPYHCQLHGGPGGQGMASTITVQG